MMINSKVSIFLFAHQDDEYGIFQKILDEQANGCRVFCFYLTSGVSSGSTPAQRNRESRFVLKRLGVQDSNIVFAGRDLSIADGRLFRHLDRAGAWIKDKISGFSNIESIYVPAWEGGHHDHDALYALTVLLAEQRGLLDRVVQFSLYHGKSCPGTLFRVCSPLKENGAVQRSRIPFSNRFKFIRYCLSYRSQFTSWIGLLPGVVFHYFSDGSQLTQKARSERIDQRPHAGCLYYEARGFCTWEELNASIIKWRESEC